MPEPSMHVDCPNCGQRVVDMTAADALKFDGPETFHDALMTLLHAHSDTCTPEPPTLPKAMRRARTGWRWRHGIVLGAFIAVFAIHLPTPAWYEHLYVIPIVGSYAMSVYATQHLVYRQGYIRGRFSASMNQRPVAAKYLHPADGLDDPSDT